MFWLLVPVSVAFLAAACSDGIRAGDGPGAEVRNFTGAQTRIVWAQGDGTDPAAEGTQLILMGFDSDDGRGERIILGDRRSYHKPKLTSRADRIVFSSFMIPGPSETFIVNWDGTGLRKLADGFALTLWQNPVDGQDWVYVGTDAVKYDFKTVSRFPLMRPRNVNWCGIPRW